MQLNQYNFSGYGQTMTMADAVDLVKSLKKSARDDKKQAYSAATKFMEGMYDRSAAMRAKLARQLQNDIDHQRTSYPDARADYELTLSA